MTRTALALRRIIRSIGVAARPTTTQELPVIAKRVVRDLHTNTSPALRSSEPPIFQSPLDKTPQSRPSPFSEHILLNDLLSSIRDHLSEERSDEHPERVKGTHEAVTTSKKEIERAEVAEVREEEVEENIVDEVEPTQQDASQHASPSLTDLRSDTGNNIVVASRSVHAHPQLAVDRSDAQVQPSRRGVRRNKDQRSSAPPHPSDASDIERETKRRWLMKSTLGPQVPFKYPAISPTQYNAYLDWKAESRERRTEHLSTYHDYEKHPMEEEWALAYDILKSITNKGAETYARWKKTYVLPPSSRIRWFVDPGEAIAIIQASTGSHLQVQNSQLSKSDPDVRHRFSLTGTRTENEAACDMIIRRGLFEIERPTDTPESARAFLEGALSYEQKIEGDVFLEQGVTPRTSWQSLRPHLDIKQLVAASMKDIVLPEVQLYAAISLLTTPRAVQERRQLIEAHQQSDIIPQALGRLLCNPENVPNTMTATLVTAWQYLVDQNAYPILRQIQRAHEARAAKHPLEKVSALSTASMNQLLKSGAKARDIHFTAHTLGMMQEHGLRADFETWVQFLDITHLHFAEKSDQVRDSMRAYGMLEDNKKRAAIAYTQVEAWLQQELASIAEKSSQLPRSFMPNFIKQTQQRIGVASWLPVNAVTKVVAVLLAHGYWEAAFQVVEMHVQRRSKLPWVIYGQLFDAASRKGHENADLAVQIIQRLSPFIDTSVSFPASRSINETTSSGASVVQIRSQAYEWLFEIALATYSWNLLKVVWQHACCAGQVTRAMEQAMHHSLKARMTTVAEAIPGLGLRGFWKVSFAMFAVGMGKSRPLQKHLSIKHLSYVGMQRLTRDLHAYGALQPLSQLSADMLAARELDRQWLKDASKTQHLSVAVPGKSSRRSDLGWRAIWPFDSIFDLAYRGMIVPVVAISSKTTQRQSSLSRETTRQK